MSAFQIFSIVMAALVFVWAIAVGVFSGEKYMMWYFRNLGGGSEYDPKKFKVVQE